MGLISGQRKHKKYLRIKAKRREKVYIKSLEKKTALEEQTKIAFTRVYKINLSNFSKDFLLRLIYPVDSKINYIHSDNGAEFEGSFAEACKDLNLCPVYSRPHTPKDNPALERFNRTIQDEWLSMSEVGLDEINDANKDNTNWFIEYNSLSPHETLDQLTTLEYAQEYYFKVSPMWSARQELDVQIL